MHRIVQSLFVVAVVSLVAMALVSPASALDPAQVIVQTLATSEEADILVFPARVKSAVQTKILAESEGVVTVIPVHVGQRVSRRDRLMTLKHTDPVYQYAPVKVTSPVSGTVSSLEVTEGTNVTKGEWLATVTDPARLRIGIEVPAQDLAKISGEMRGEFRASSAAEPLAVKIIGVSPLVDPKTGTAPADLIFLEKDLPPPGTLGQVTLRANRHSALLVPEDAVVYRDGKTFLRRLAGETVKLVVVELGERRRGKVEIKTGVAIGERIVLRSSRFVSDGEVVKVEEEKLERAKS